MATLLREKTVFEDKLTIQKGEFESGGKNYYRLRVKREDAAAILVLNTDSKKVILTKQFRYAIADKIEEELLEIVAGKIDPNEDSVQCALRETEEETGYKIKPGNLQIMLTCFSSPGYTSERFVVFYARVNSSDKISEGGGLKNEHEEIDLVEMDVKEFIENIKMARFKDAKTYIAGLYMLSHNLFT